MMGGKGNNQYSNRAVGIRVQSSLYGQVVPYLAGRFRITPKLIWAGALAAKKVSSGKKSGGKKGGQTYTYSAPADFLLAHYPVQAIFAGWCNSDYWPVAVSRQRLVVGSGHVTIAPTGVLLGIAGVYLIDAYAAAFNDFGGDGPVGVSGTWNNPLWNEFWPCPDGSAGTTRRPYTYKWKPSDGNTVTIADASLAGKTVEVWVVTQIGTSRATNLPSSPQYSPTGGVGNADILTQLNLELERYLASGSEYASNPANKLPYNWVSGLGSTKFDMGNQPMFPQFQPEAQGAMDLWPEGGADPADIITDIVTSGKQVAADAPYAGVTIGVGHGLNINAFPGNTIPAELSSFLGDLTAMRNYCRAYKIMASVYQETQIAAKQVLEDLFEIANCAPVYSGSQLKAIPYCEVSAADNGGVFTAPTASGPVYDLDDTCFFYKSGEMPIQIDRQRQSAAKNVFKLGHVCDNSEPTNTRGDYNDDTTTEPEQRSIAEFGPRPADARQMRYVTKKSVARKVASVLVKRSAYIRNHYRFSLKAEFFWLEAMDLITLTDAKLGLNKQAVRLTSIKENFPEARGRKRRGRMDVRV
jgi:hypothetical protein